MTHYETLGVEKTATAEEIKKAYRKLANIHHPDKGGVEAKFKEVQGAYDVLGDAEKRKQYDSGGQGPWTGTGGHGFQPGNMDDFIRQFHEAQRAHQQRTTIPFVRIMVPIKDAFTGCVVSLQVDGQKVPYTVRAGLPPGVAYLDDVKVGTEKRQAQIQLKIDSGKFRFRQIGSEDGLVFPGDLETDVEVDALDILAGAFIFVEDFMGKRLQVRVPSGFDPKLKLKVAGHGYTTWMGDKPGKRADLFLVVKPIFKSVTDLDPKKVEALYNATRSTTKDPKNDVPRTA